jgi:hypothetical protein
VVVVVVVEKVVKIGGGLYAMVVGVVVEVVDGLKVVVVVVVELVVVGVVGVVVFIVVDVVVDGDVVGNNLVVVDVGATIFVVEIGTYGTVRLTLTTNSKKER